MRPSRPDAPQGVTWAIQPDGYRARGQTLWSTLMLAYFPGTPMEWKSEMLAGVPAWASSTMYDLDARVSAADAKAWREQDKQHALLSAMLQSALRERCGLIAHRMVTKRKVFALVVDKRGPKLQATPPGRPPSPEGISFGEGRLIPGDRILQLRGISMATLAGYLTNTSPRTIVDQTGLPGLYDVTLTHNEQDSDGRGEPEGPSAWNVGRLGLLLKSTEIDGTRVVVDHLERPSPN